MAAAGQCAMTPQTLLAELKTLEQKLGRIDRGRWAPREIDLDILIYDDVVMDEDGLTLPHPQLLNRHFALAPLVDVAPDAMIDGRPVKDWLAERFP
jgi:2-amino-4-hydroxy-6-hydroxymethyldihydropteridine diphosphokinase